MMKKKELNEIIREEKSLYVGSDYFYRKFTHNKRYMIWKYLSLFRLSQYYEEALSHSAGIQKIYFGVVYRLSVRRKNIMGEKCGVEIGNRFRIGRRLDIYHGGVVIAANLGDDCTIRGNTIIGNKGKKRFNGHPTIGNGVEIGAGAGIFGDVQIADNCEIGPNAVVVKSFLEPGSILVGVPARKREGG